jgi:DNA polymerase III subunit delta
MATFKQAYLIHGDDHGRISERRARLRILAEDASGAQGVEVLDGERGTPADAAAALSAMTFTIGRRFIVVDGAERWKDRELDELSSAMNPIPPDTTIAFFAREDTRLKAPPRLHELVGTAGGDISAENGVKPWELPKWVLARAAELGVKLDRDAARALVEHVGERQQRLLRELEKLTLEFGDGRPIGAEEIDELTAASAERKVWALADALVGSDQAAAAALYLALRAQGERVTGLLYWMTQRVQTAVEVAQALDRGESAAQLKRGLRMPSRAADRLIADARRAGADRLRRALEQLADLELASRGGGPGAASEDTAMLLAIERIAADGARSG